MIFCVSSKLGLEKIRGKTTKSTILFGIIVKSSVIQWILVKDYTQISLFLVLIVAKTFFHRASKLALTRRRVTQLDDSKTTKRNFNGSIWMGSRCFSFGSLRTICSPLVPAGRWRWRLKWPDRATAADFIRGGLRSFGSANERVLPEARLSFRLTVADGWNGVPERTMTSVISALITGSSVVAIGCDVILIDSPLVGDRWGRYRARLIAVSLCLLVAKIAHLIITASGLGAFASRAGCSNGNRISMGFVGLPLFTTTKTLDNYLDLLQVDESACVFDAKSCL